MKYIQTFEKSKEKSKLDYQVGDQIVLSRLTKYDLKMGFKKGVIYTISGIEIGYSTYPISIKKDGREFIFGLYQIRKATSREIEVSKYNL